VSAVAIAAPHALLLLSVSHFRKSLCSAATSRLFRSRHQRSSKRHANPAFAGLHSLCGAARCVAQMFHGCQFKSPFAPKRKFLFPRPGADDRLLLRISVAAIRAPCELRLKYDPKGLAGTSPGGSILEPFSVPIRR
jgi:hypothetical protein